MSCMKTVRQQLARALKRYSPLFPDRLYLQLLYYFTMGKRLHLDHPVMFSENCNG